MTDWRFIFEKWVLQQHRPEYEPEIVRRLKQIHGRLFVDVGARDGFYSRLLRKNFKQILSFEPNPSNLFEPTYRIALADYDVDAQDFFLNTNNGSADTLLKAFSYHPNPSAGKPQIFKTDRVIKVTVRRYDSIVKACADLVKIDVEGAELTVLKGMSNNPPKRIMVELHDIDNEQQLIYLLSNYGYTIQKLDNHPRFLAS